MYKVIGIVCLAAMVFSCKISNSVSNGNDNGNGGGNGGGGDGGDGGVYIYPEQDQISFALGEKHSIIKTKSGELYSLGNNEKGQLGLGNLLSPVGTREKIKQSADNSTLPSIVAIVAGYNHNIAIAISGVLYTWGEGIHGKLGIGTRDNQPRPVLIKTISASQGGGVLGNLIFTSVSGGWNHSLASTTDGRLFSWGMADNGRLGDGRSFGETQSPTEIAQYKNASGSMVDLPVISAVFAGADFSVALSKEQELLVWGENVAGQLGLGDRSDRLFPEKLLNFYDENGTPMPSRPKIKSLATGWRHALAISTSGELFEWGSNGDAPRLVTNYTKSGGATETLPPVVMLAGGGEFSVALTESGMVLTWGKNNYGELGRGSAASAASTTPSAVTHYGTGGPTDLLPPIARIYVGDHHVFAYAENGKLFAWGNNADKQLGITDATSTVYYPRDVSFLLP